MFSYIITCNATENLHIGEKCQNEKDITLFINAVGLSNLKKKFIKIKSKILTPGNLRFEEIPTASLDKVDCLLPSYIKYTVLKTFLQISEEIFLFVETKKHI
jgi:hypothetical protein